MCLLAWKFSFVCTCKCKDLQTEGMQEPFGVQLCYSHLLLLPVWPRFELRKKQWRLREVKQPLSHIKITLALTCQRCIICMATSPAKSQTDLPSYELSPQIIFIKASNQSTKNEFFNFIYARVWNLCNSVILPKVLRQITDVGTFAILNESLKIKIFIKLIHLGSKVAELCVKSRSQKAAAVFHWVLHDPGRKGDHNTNNVLQQWQNKEESKEF